MYCSADVLSDRNFSDPIFFLEKLTLVTMQKYVAKTMLLANLKKRENIKTQHYAMLGYTQSAHLPVRRRNVMINTSFFSKLAEGLFFV